MYNVSYFDKNGQNSVTLLVFYGNNIRYKSETTILYNHNTLTGYILIIR